MRTNFDVELLSEISLSVDYYLCARQSMPSDLDISSLAIWLHSHNPTAPLASLQASLESDKHLSLALHQLKAAIGTRENDQDRDHDAQRARQKVSAYPSLR